MLAALRMTIVRECYQDGADFYDATHDGHIATYPHKVADGDTVTATAARQWFVGWCEKHSNIEPYFP